MSMLFLSEDEQKHLNDAIKCMEAINGTDCYCERNVYSSKCNEWDCFFSCHCANSFK